MNMAEQILFLTLSDIYRRFRSADISRAEGDSLFREAARQFEQNSVKLDMLNRVSLNQAELWKNIETAANNYYLSGNRTPEADAFVEAVYNIKLKQKGSDNSDS